MNKRIHFIGSEGVSMKMLKAISEKNGYAVSGSDITVDGHHAENVDGAGLVVYSAAIKEDNPELVRALELGVPVLSRAEFLGKICGDYEFSVAVSGSHGKTTTTAMLWEVLRPLNPTVHIGGNYNGQIGRAGGRHLFITEACEYKHSFLTLSPDIAVILNIDLDHTDCYKNLAELQNAFSEFALKAKKLIVYNGDDENFFTEDMLDIPIMPGEKCLRFTKNTCLLLNDENCSASNSVSNKEKQFKSNPQTKALEKEDTESYSQINMPDLFQTNMPDYQSTAEINSHQKPEASFKAKPEVSSQIRRVRSVGFKRGNHYCATCISPDKKGRYSFCVYECGNRLGRVSLSVAGRHNVYNALAAIAVSRDLGMSFGRISAGLSRFCGAERRMEFLGYREGCAVFSDYAHHPKEIAMSLQSARESGYKHITVIFEPHTYTRTQSFFEDFVRSLGQADRIILVPIYPAREQPIAGVESKLIVDELKQKGADSLYFDSYAEAENYLKKDLKDDGILMFMGAGTIDGLARKFIKNAE